MTGVYVCVWCVWSFIDGARAYTAEIDRLSLGVRKNGIGISGEKRPSPEVL